MVREPTWETAIRVPIDVLARSSDLSISIFEAPEHLYSTRTRRGRSLRECGPPRCWRAVRSCRARDLPDGVFGGTGRKRTRPREH